MLSRAGDPISGLGGRSPKSELIYLKVGGAKVAFRPPSKIIEGANIIYAERGSARL